MHVKRTNEGIERHVSAGTAEAEWRVGEDSGETKCAVAGEGESVQMRKRAQPARHNTPVSAN